MHVVQTRRHELGSTWHPNLRSWPAWQRRALEAGVAMTASWQCTGGANGEMHTARFGFLSKTEAAVRRIGPLRRTEALLAFAPLN